MTRILIFGTFDIVHEGHRDLFRQARALAADPYLIVSVARDSAVFRIKGQAAKRNEQERLAAVGSEALVDEAVLGSESDHIEHIRVLSPEIIALGYDQRGEYVEDLEERLKQGGIKANVVRLKPYHPEKYKSSRLNSAT